MTTARRGSGGAAPPGEALRRAVERWAMEDRPALRVLDAGTGRPGVVECGGRPHTIEVVGGDLVLHDHDELAEISMVAFGAHPPACLVYALAWRDALSLRTFFASWAGVERPDAAAAALDRHEWDENYWENWPSDPAAATVLFSPPLQDELALLVARRWAVALTPDQARLLALAVRVRARARFVQSITAIDAHPKPDALVPLRVEVPMNGGAGRMTGTLARTGSAVALTLPLEWLWTVWGAGLALVDGDLVLERTPPEGARVRAVHWVSMGGPGSPHHPVDHEVAVPAAARTAIANSTSG